MPHTPGEGDEGMTSKGSLRGDINAILNPLVAAGTIKGFSTNLYEKPQEAEEVCRRVSQVLAPLGQHIVVQAEVRGPRGR